MCFGGGNKQPAAATPPTPAPPPTIMPTEVSDSSAQTAGKKRRENLRYGLASTIRTSARGITGAGPELQSPTLLGQKTSLGA